MRRFVLRLREERGQGVTSTFLAAKGPAVRSQDGALPTVAEEEILLAANDVLALRAQPSRALHLLEDAPAIGASWFAAGKGAILAGFPGSTAEAVACTIGGAAVMLWALSRILREIAKQAPEMQAKYDAYIAAHHPDKVRPKSEDEGQQP